jgi:hypothetical protein
MMDYSRDPTNALPIQRRINFRFHGSCPVYPNFIPDIRTILLRIIPLLPNDTAINPANKFKSQDRYNTDDTTHPIHFTERLAGAILRDSPATSPRTPDVAAENEQLLW